MPGNTDSPAWRIVTDHGRIRGLAEEHGHVPVSTEREDAGVALRDTGSAGGDGERVSWETFFDRLDAAGRVVGYRPPESGAESTATFRIVSAAGEGEGEPAVRPTDQGNEAEADQIATSDTGDYEPVVYDQTEDEAEAHTDDGEAATADTERGPTEMARGLVVDEIHEGARGLGDELANEYVVFVNEGEKRIDLSGWTVENEGGRSYRFPADSGLDPGERVTLHSGSGADAEGHRYWNADTPVWGNRGDTVTVKTAAGERVLRERYEA